MLQENMCLISRGDPNLNWTQLSANDVGFFWWSRTYRFYFFLKTHHEVDSLLLESLGIISKIAQEANNSMKENVSISVVSKRWWFNWCHSWTPPPCRTFQKLGVLNFLLERGDKPDVEMGGCHFFYYFTVQSHLLCMWEK